MGSDEPHPLYPNCDYDLHGLRGSTCPECGGHVDIEAILRATVAGLGLYRYRVTLAVIGLLAAVPVGTVLLCIFTMALNGRLYLKDPSVVSDAFFVTFLVPGFWRPFPVVALLTVSVSTALFIVAMRSGRRWYLAILGVLLIDAAWIVAIWCGVQSLMNI